MARVDLTPHLLLMSGGERTAPADSHQRVLNALRLLPPLVPLTAVVDVVGLHANTVRERLDSLVSEGLAETQIDRTGSRGRPRTLYRLTAPGMLRRAPGEEALRLAGIVLEAFGQGEAEARSTAIAAGARWGDEVAAALVDVATPVDRLLIALDALGAEPALDGAAAEGVGCVHVERCPFQALAAVRPDVVCAIHAAAITQVAKGLDGADVTATVRRAPGSEGGACKVDLERAPAAQVPVGRA